MAPDATQLSGPALMAALVLLVAYGAFVVLVAFGAFVVFLVVEVDASEVRWSRPCLAIRFRGGDRFRGGRSLTATERGEYEVWKPR